MDPIALVIIGIVVAGIAWWTLFRDNDTTEFPDSPQQPIPQPPTTSDAYKAPTSADAFKKAPKPKVPAKADSMTKAQIESEARSQGVELDKRMTKANMIADWKKQLKTK